MLASLAMLPHLTTPAAMHAEPNPYHIEPGATFPKFTTPGPDNGQLAEQAAAAFDTFTHHYVAAALQLADEELGPDATADQLAPEARARMIADCARFQAEQATALAAGYTYATEQAPNAAVTQWLGQGATDWYDAQAGTNFWLNRNGHGTGFWDSPKLYGEQAAAALDEAARTYAETDLYLGDDGLVYCY